MMAKLALLLVLLQADPQDEYKQRSAALKDSDTDGHYKLGLWCEQHKLDTEARTEFEKAIVASPNHSEARVKLGYAKVRGKWVSKRIREVVAKGLTFPADEETRTMRARSPYYAAVIDVFWEKENWQVALAAIEERTGLFDGTLEIKVSFGTLGSVPAQGWGTGGKGQITLDMKFLAEYARTIDDFQKKAKQGGTVVVPPAKLEGILTHELTHCFQGADQPSWFLEGMATWCAQDGHYVYYFRNDKQKVRDIEDEIEYKFNYGRGWAFFEYLESKLGRTGMREFLKLTLVEQIPAKEATARLTKSEWDAFKKQEREASAKWIAQFKH